MFLKSFARGLLYLGEKDYLTLLLCLEVKKAKCMSEHVLHAPQELLWWDNCVTLTFSNDYILLNSSYQLENEVIPAFPWIRSSKISSPRKQFGTIRILYLNRMHFVFTMSFLSILIRLCDNRFTAVMRIHHLVYWTRKYVDTIDL